MKLISGIEEKLPDAKEGGGGGCWGRGLQGLAKLLEVQNRRKLHSPTAQQVTRVHPNALSFLAADRGL